MSFPPDKTFLHSTMNKLDNTKPLVVNGVPTIHYYVKEIKHLEEEINYWTTEHQLYPSEIKLNKIHNLSDELQIIKNKYTLICNLHK